MNIYAGNLSPDVTEDDLKEAFKAFGQFESVNLIKDKFSGASRCFAFIEMASDKEGQAAIDGLNGKDLKGTPLTVNEARTQKGKPRNR